MKKFFLFFIILCPLTLLEAKCFKSSLLNEHYEKKLSRSCDTFPATFPQTMLTLISPADVDLYQQDFERLPELVDFSLQGTPQKPITVKLHGNVFAETYMVSIYKFIKDVDLSEGSLSSKSSIHVINFRELNTQKLSNFLTVYGKSGDVLDFGSRVFSSLNVKGVKEVRNASVRGTLSLEGSKGHRISAHNVSLNSSSVYLYHADVFGDGKNYSTNSLHLYNSRIVDSALSVNQHNLYVAHSELTCASDFDGNLTYVSIEHSVLHGCRFRSMKKTTHLTVLGTKLELDSSPDFSILKSLVLGGPVKLPGNLLKVNVGEKLVYLTLLELDLEKVDIQFNSPKSLLFLNLFGDYQVNYLNPREIKKLPPDFRVIIKDEDLFKQSKNLFKDKDLHRLDWIGL